MARIKKTPALSVDLPQKVKDDLRKYAKQNDETISRLVRRIINDFLRDAAID